MTSQLETLLNINTPHCISALMWAFWQCQTSLRFGRVLCGRDLGHEERSFVGGFVNEFYCQKFCKPVVGLEGAFCFVPFDE